MFGFSVARYAAARFITYQAFLREGKPRNVDFYKHAPLYQNDIKKNSLLERAGLQNSADVQALMPVIQSIPTKMSSLRIFEVGSGSGRVARALQESVKVSPINFTYRGVESDEEYYAMATGDYKGSKKIRFVNDNILNYNFKKHEYYHVILLLWCMIYEFSPAERSVLIKTLYDRLYDKGVIIIDFPPENIAFTNITGRNDSGSVSIKMDGVPLWNGYDCDISELEEMTQTLEGASAEERVYSVDRDSNRERTFYCLFKSSDSMPMQPLKKPLLDGNSRPGNCS